LEILIFKNQDGKALLIDAIPWFLLKEKIYFSTTNHLGLRLFLAKKI